jgi:hypothetical protein
MIQFFDVRSVRVLNGSRVRWACLALAVFAGGACYSYVEVPADAVSPGDKVRVTMTRDEVLRQADLLERLDEDLEATVMENNPGTGLSVTFPDPNSAVAGPEFNRLITIPWGGVIRVEGQQFSLAKTLGAVGIGAVIGSAVIAVVTGGSEGNRSGETPPIDQDRWIPIPIFRIPVPF